MCNELCKIHQFWRVQVISLVKLAPPHEEQEMRYKRGWLQSIWFIHWIFDSLCMNIYWRNTSVLEAATGVVLTKVKAQCLKWQLHFCTLSNWHISLPDKVNTFQIFIIPWQHWISVQNIQQKCISIMWLNDWIVVLWRSWSCIFSIN